MRQIATFERQSQALQAAQWLAAAGIPHKLELARNGWSLSIHDDGDFEATRHALLAWQATSREGATSQAPNAARAMSASTETSPPPSRPSHHARMPVTWALMAASIATALWTDLGNDHDRLNPLLIAPVVIQGNRVGWNGLDEIFTHGQVWRLISPAFIHFGMEHIVFNMIMLYQLGAIVEVMRGPLRYSLLVLVLAIASNLAQYQFGGDRLSLGGPMFGGMSGVLYGLFGYLWMKTWLDKRMRASLRPGAVVPMLAWFVACWVGIIPDVANMAHTAGLVMGMAIGAVDAHAWRLWPPPAGVTAAAPSDEIG